jgi:hypothetical protein
MFHFFFHGKNSEKDIFRRQNFEFSRNNVCREFRLDASPEAFIKKLYQLVPVSMHVLESHLILCLVCRAYFRIAWGIDLKLCTQVS